jgi:hypothetical protein
MGQRGTAIYADELRPRVSIRMARATLAAQRRTPRTSTLQVMFGKHSTVELELIVCPGHGAVRTRTSIKCPAVACARPATMIGYHPRAGWGCRRCQKWQYRSRAQRGAALLVALGGGMIGATDSNHDLGRTMEDRGVGRDACGEITSGCAATPGEKVPSLDSSMNY